VGADLGIDRPDDGRLVGEREVLDDRDRKIMVALKPSAREWLAEKGVGSGLRRASAQARDPEARMGHGGGGGPSWATRRVVHRAGGDQLDDEVVQQLALGSLFLLSRAALWPRRRSPTSWAEQHRPARRERPACPQQVQRVRVSVPDRFLADARRIDRLQRQRDLDKLSLAPRSTALLAHHNIEECYSHWEGSIFRFAFC
jgi:hypothetical protein